MRNIQYMYLHVHSMYCPGTCAELKPFWNSLETNIQDGTGKLEAALASHHYLLSVCVLCSPKCFSEFCSSQVTTLRRRLLDYKGLEFRCFIALSLAAAPNLSVQGFSCGTFHNLSRGKGPLRLAMQLSMLKNTHGALDDRRHLITAQPHTPDRSPRQFPTVIIDFASLLSLQCYCLPRQFPHQVGRQWSSNMLCSRASFFIAAFRAYVIGWGDGLST